MNPKRNIDDASTLERVVKCLQANGISDCDHHKYSHHDTAITGFSFEHPLVINDTTEFVSFERDVIDFLMSHCENVIDYHELQQEYMELNGRRYDSILVLVRTLEGEENLVEFVFDITGVMKDEDPRLKILLDLDDLPF